MNYFTRWLVARATEKSTYVGLAILAGTVGQAALAEQINQVGTAVGLIAGTLVAAASTSQRP